MNTFVIAFITAGFVDVARARCTSAYSISEGPPSAEVSIPASIELPRLLDLAALRLRVAIDYDPANTQLKGQQVTLRQPGAGAGGTGAGNGGMSDQELWGTVSRLLAQRGLTTVRGPASTSYSVVKLDEAARLARLEVAVFASEEGAGAVGGGGAVSAEPVAGFRNQPVKLRYVSLKEAGEALRAVQRTGTVGGGAATAGGPVGAAGGAGSSGDTLLLSDTSARIDEQLAVLRQLDTPENATVMVPVAVSNIAPAQAVATVMQLATKREGVSGEKLPGEVVVGGGTGTVAGGAGGGGGVLIIAPKRVVERWKQLVTLADQREPVTTQTYTPRLFSVKDVGGLIQQIAGEKAAAGFVDERFRVVMEEPTGSLIVTATPAQHEKIEALMARLDAVPGESRRPVRSFLIRNRTVGKFVTTLQSLIGAGVLDSGSDLSGIGGGSGSSPSASTPNGLSTTPPPITSVLPASMSPVVPTQPGLPNQMASGQARPSGAGRGGHTLPLTLTADESTNTIIAVGDGRLLDQLDALIKTLDVRQPQVMLEAFIVSLNDSDTTQLGVELQQLSYSNNMLTRLSSVFGLGPTGSESGPGVPISRGSSGGSAIILDPGDYAIAVRALQTIKKGRTVSAPKVLVCNNEEATLNSVKQIAFSASFTAGNSATPTTSFGGTQDAGTQMTIRPQISDGGALLLDYNISISQFGDASGNSNLPPNRDVTSVQSLATIPDGYAIVVTGLELTTDSHHEDRVPLLGEIPLLGNLFKSQSNDKANSRFFVFIRASVMRDQALESLRYVSDADAAAAQLPPSWPKNSPQVVR